MRRFAVSFMAAGALLLMLPGPQPARAVTLVTTGWWWRAQTSALPAPLPPPPTVGDDQLLVEGTPEGATAWAGVAYTLAPGETAPILTVVAADPDLVPETSVIVAFRASVPFQKATAGVWENRPLLDFSASVRGIPDGPGRFVFPVAPLLSGPDLNIVLAPGIADRVPSTFSMRFTRPSVQSLKVTFADPTASTVLPTPTFPAPVVPFDPGALADLPPVTPPSSTPAVPDAPAIAPQDRRPNEVEIGAPSTPLPAQPVSTDIDAATRVFGALMLLAGLGFALWSWTTPAPTTIGLGRFRRQLPPSEAQREPEMGGLGRFAKPRTERAPPLA